MLTIRTIVGFLLAVIIINGLYYEYINTLYIIINMAVLYDISYLLTKLKINPYTVVGIFGFMIFFNIYLLNMYHYNPYGMIRIAIIAQTSDIFQYLSGKYLGKNRIGWVSKNKTYEGYIIGCLMTVVTFMPLYYYSENMKGFFGIGKIFMQKNPIIDNSYLEIFWIYILGVIGGLCSSLFKRIQNIKDYSNLLGPHGGWMDRVDSIILPALILGLIN